MTQLQVQNYLINNAVDEMTRFYMDDHNAGIPEALDAIYNSETYNKLIDTENGLYIQSPAYIYELLNLEKSGHTPSSSNSTPGKTPNNL